jgi:hypothetical protein
MERELWPILYRTVRAVGADFRQKYVQIPGWVLLLTALWAALHDRPLSWATDPDNWRTTRLHPYRIPSSATLSRRLDHIGLGLLWRAVEVRLRHTAAEYPGVVAFLDGKPLPVGGASKDREARPGRAVGGFARGYKLHAIWSTRVVPEVWELTPLNESEPQVAHGLIPQLTAGGYLLADGNYDGSPLFDRAAGQGYQLVTPLPTGTPGGGHHYQSPHRLRSLALMQTPFGQALYATRIAVEQSFGHATAFGGGLAPLPAWVRGRDRVRTWVWAKLLINAARIINLKNLRHP